MDYKSKSVVNNMEELEGDIRFFLKMSKYYTYNKDFKLALTDWIKFNYGEDVIVNFPNFREIKIRKPNENVVIVTY